MASFGTRISKWGVASVALLVGEIAVGEYNLYQHDHGQRPLLAFWQADRLCVLVQLAAVVCGVIAMRRGSKWWALTVIPAIWLALTCFFGEL
jgi:hypothetical protein